MRFQVILLFALSAAIIGGAYWARVRYNKNINTEIVRAVQKNIADELVSIDNEANSLIADSLRTTSAGWESSKHFFIHIDSNTVRCWSRNYFLPDLGSLRHDEDTFFLSQGRGDFIVRRWPAARGDLFCFLTLADRYPITNNFLEPGLNPQIFPQSDISIVGPQTTFGEPVTLNGQTLFSIAVKAPERQDSTLSFLLLTAGLTILLVALWKTVGPLETRFGYDTSFVFILAAFILLRLGMVATGYPSRYVDSRVFEPSVFASSFINSSLGDLLINAACVLFLVGYLFVHFRRLRLVRWLLSLRGYPAFLAGVVCLFACYFGLLFPYNFVEVIYHNSTLSLDLMQSLSFDAVRVSAVISVLTSCVSSFLFVHTFLSLAKHLVKGKAGLIAANLLAAGMFVLQSTYSGQSYLITLSLGLFAFSIAGLLDHVPGKFKFSFLLFIYLVFSLTVLSLQNSLAVRRFFRERQARDEFRYAKDFLTERDVLGEYLLNQARQRIEKDQFIQMRMASPFLSKSVVADKIRRVHLSSYFDRYEVNITTQVFDETAQRQGDSTSTNQSPPMLATGYQGILYSSGTEVNSLRRYRVICPVFYQRPAGYIILDLSLKRVVPENVYPELLVDNRFSQAYRNRDFSYSFFAGGGLANSFGAFNYERDFPLMLLEDPELYHDGVEYKGNHHIGIEDVDGSIAVVSAPVYTWFFLVTNFSFWFVMGLVLLLGVQGALGVYYFIKGELFNYSARIQLFVFLAFLLPVVAVSITTLTLIARSNEQAIQQDFLGRSTTIGQRISGLVSVRQSDNQDTSLDDWIKENAASLRTDISVYSPDGRLIATSQPALFENQLLAPLMDHGAWKRIAGNHETETVSNEQIGKLKYSCAYSAARSPGSGKLLAIVGLPFFESAAFLQKSQLLIVGNTLLVFVVVFILFSLLSFWASRNLTYPIRLMSRTLGQTTLTGENKFLQWDTPDEIGVLIKQYNRMLVNLEESKRVLAQSEKESAWREMARQVAHEIKNPLTPMKLTLQQMEQSIRTGDLSMEKSQKSVDVLLKQVDILNRIAASFSSFASMPSAAPGNVNLVAVLKDTIALFQAEPHSRVFYSGQEDPVHVSVDQTSFSRAISNIIINALQSRKDGQELLTVEVSTEIKPSRIVVMIRDDGKGMTDEVKNRVFQPHFTTKQSGSGLGLLMTRQIVVQAGGSIWFESVQGKGTTFFIEVQLVV